mgnify:CR=1 FL=1
MPSALTHAYVGAALAALAPRWLRGVRFALLLAALAAAPDLDVIAFAVGIPYEHRFGHRGARSLRGRAENKRVSWDLERISVRPDMRERVGWGGCALADR